MDEVKNIIYLSTALSDEIYNHIVKSCKSFKPTFSGVGFDRNVAMGLSKYAKVYGISRYPIPSWPKYEKVVQAHQNFMLQSFECYVPRMINVPIIKEIDYANGGYTYAKKLELNKKDSIVVLSGLYRSLLKTAGLLKNKYGYRVCAIVPDLPELMIAYRKDYSKIRQFFNKVDVEKTKSYFGVVDGFVFLSKFMNEKVNAYRKPYVIVDGLTDIQTFPKHVSSENERYILYAGKVSATFGVDKLVNAFIDTKIEDVKLYICGDGDYADALRTIASYNENIVYFGAVDHSKVLELESGAELLVDPRPSSMEIVKMSFPSKIIEYMASGTPVLTTNLPCFSEEYKEYQFRIDDESITGIGKALVDFFELPKEERNRMGTAAQQFVLEHKTISKQCELIFELLNMIEG